VEWSGVEWSGVELLQHSKPRDIKGKIFNIYAWADSQSSIAKGPETMSQTNPQMSVGQPLKRQGCALVK
jgi:hypothetical protein